MCLGILQFKGQDFNESHKYKTNTLYIVHFVAFKDIDPLLNENDKTTSSPKGSNSGTFYKISFRFTSDNWILRMIKSKCHDAKRNNKLTGKPAIAGFFFKEGDDL